MLRVFRLQGWKENNAGSNKLQTTGWTALLIIRFSDSLSGKLIKQDNDHLDWLEQSELIHSEGIETQVLYQNEQTDSDSTNFLLLIFTLSLH